MLVELTEAEPREEEYSSILVEWVENWNRSSFSIDWVDLWRLPEGLDLEYHDFGMSALIFRNGRLGKCLAKYSDG